MEGKLISSSPLCVYSEATVGVAYSKGLKLNLWVGGLQVFLTLHECEPGTYQPGSFPAYRSKAVQNSAQWLPHMAQIEAILLDS